MSFSWLFPLVSHPILFLHSACSSVCCHSSSCPFSYCLTCRCSSFPPFAPPFTPLANPHLILLPLLPYHRISLRILGCTILSFFVLFSPPSLTPPSFLFPCLLATPPLAPSPILDPSPPLLSPFHSCSFFYSSFSFSPACTPHVALPHSLTLHYAMHPIYCPSLSSFPLLLLLLLFFFFHVFLHLILLFLLLLLPSSCSNPSSPSASFSFALN